jgi:type II secretory pathway pseudopilin PulG
LFLVGVVLVAALVILVISMEVAREESQKAARRFQCLNNLRQIALALQNYRDDFGCFPPAYVADDAGKPMHSWRVLILPYMDRKEVYSQYNFNEPWDGPTNSRLNSYVVRNTFVPASSGTSQRPRRATSRSWEK